MGTPTTAPSSSRRRHVSLACAISASVAPVSKRTPSLLASLHSPLLSQTYGMPYPSRLMGTKPSTKADELVFTPLQYWSFALSKGLGGTWTAKSATMEDVLVSTSVRVGTRVRLLHKDADARIVDGSYCANSKYCSSVRSLPMPYLSPGAISCSSAPPEDAMPSITNTLFRLFDSFSCVLCRPHTGVWLIRIPYFLPGGR
mmetsp:Transcript_8660/g.35309  ORF Transcript_8660/g.35309 Transcript_8660/m.35309 type:complete len:200 (-) Transcript_8660:1352-1951(-)